MKFFIFLTGLQFITYVSFGQNSLNNTIWKGVMLIPDAVDVRLNFKKDSLYLTTDTGQEIGTLIFSQRGDTLTIRKVSGRSPCPEQTIGIYKIEFLENGKKIQLHGISDECEGRIGVYTLNAFEKVSDKQ